MTPIRWRRAKIGDAPALSVLGGATFLCSFAHDHPGDALITHIHAAHSESYYKGALADTAQTLFIGETPLGAPVGYAMLTPPNLPVATGQADVEIKRIYLLPGWQGDGHGDALMDLFAKEACRRGTHRILQAVYPQNDRTRRFYARHGFEQFGETTFMVGNVPFRGLVHARLLWRAGFDRLSPTAVIPARWILRA